MWEVAKPIHYSGKDEDWVVPVGFLTDFASVPAIVVWLIPKYGKYTLAAILHDWFCAVGILQGAISARDADGVFRRVMREAEVPFTRRWLMWCGVRWGALFNKVRRPGWYKDAPLVLLITFLAGPLIIPAGVLAAITLVIYWPIETIVDIFSKARSQ